MLNSNFKIKYYSLIFVFEKLFCRYALDTFKNHKLGEGLTVKK